MNDDFDPAPIDRLKSLLGTAFPALAESFQSHLLTSLTTLQAALSRGQLEEAREIAHRMRSSAAQFGLAGMARAAERFERHEIYEDAGRLAAEIERHYHAVMPQLQNALQGNPV